MIFPRRVPATIVVMYKSGRQEKHKYSSHREARKAMEAFEKLETVLSVGFDKK